MGGGGGGGGYYGGGGFGGGYGGGSSSRVDKSEDPNKLFSFQTLPMMESATGEAAA